MNNINLAFFMMVGWLQMNLAVVLTIVVLLAALYGALLVSGRSLFNGRAFGRGLIVAVIAWVVLAAMLPAMTGSSWQFVSYSTDYVMLALMSAGLAGIVFLAVYPLLAMVRKKA
ncbi:MAG: hypothetical protein ACOZAQ_07990 [Pseudomonadota bacterium]